MTRSKTSKLLGITLVAICWFFCMNSSLIAQFAPIDGLSSQESIIPQPRRESARLPKVPSVASMIGPQTNTLEILQRSSPDSFYKSSAELVDYRTRVALRQDGGNEFWCGRIYTWTAPNFYSQPLYFQQPKLELYDSSISPCLRPVVSYAKFMGTIPILPYKFIVQPIHSRAYTLGQGRPVD